MTATPDTPGFGTITNHQTGCGSECIVIDGACRCYHGEPAGPDLDWWTDLDPPY